ncbi:hypothetical protein ZWY2020_013476 [Hordeum vulgare]|nr:hypothetical protein ZWY2020_013476 [Hordeum vulgare]
MANVALFAAAASRAPPSTSPGLMIPAPPKHAASDSSPVVIVLLPGLGQLLPVSNMQRGDLPEKIQACKTWNGRLE